MGKGIAYRRKISLTKYINRLKNVLHFWVIKTNDGIHRFKYPKNWKELDASKENNHVKLYKTTTTHYKDKWKQVEKHMSHKRNRENGKKNLKTELNDID